MRLSNLLIAVLGSASIAFAASRPVNTHIFRHPWQFVTGQPRAGFMVSHLDPEPPFANACVSTKTGNWSDSTVWTSCGGGVPANGDTVSIANTHTVTVDVNTTVGASGAPLFSYVASLTLLTAGTGGSNGTATFTGGTLVANSARATYADAGSGVTAVTMIRKGMYTSGSVAPVVTFGATGGTATVNWIQGGGTAAINANATGVVNIAAGITLTVRGCISYTQGGSNLTDYMTMQPGSSLVMDASLATAGTFYSIGTVANTSGFRKFNASCTAALPCNISSDAGGAASQFGGCTVNGCSSWGGMIINHANITRMGDGASYWTWPDFTSSTVSYDVENSVFTACGIYMASVAVGTSYKHIGNYHTGTLDNEGIGIWWANAGALTTGTRILRGNYFDGRVGDGGASQGNGSTSMRDWTVTDNVFRGGFDFAGSNGPASLARNLYYFSATGASTGDNVLSDWVAGVTSTDDYWFIDWTRSNTHFVVQPTGCNTFSGSIYEQTTSSFTGVFLIPNSTNPGSPCVTSLTNMIQLPTLDNKNSGQIVSPQGSPANITYNLNHTTWVGGSTTIGPFAINENGDSIAGVGASFKSNLAWSFSPYNYFWVTNNDSTTSPTVDAISAANTGYNYSDSRLTLTQTACTPCTNQGNGYAGAYTTTPGGYSVAGGTPSHDYRGATFNFTDQARTIPLFDSKYLGKTAAPGGTCDVYDVGTCKNAWVTSTSYVVGDVVSNVGATVYNGLTVLYRCTAAHTSGATTEPGAGANWHADWEWASLETLRQEFKNGTTYTDASLQGCSVASPCYPVRARIGWIRTGYLPQNWQLYKSGHDGATIGAVDHPVTAVIAPVVY